MTNLILKGPKGNTPWVDKGLGEYFFEQAVKYSDRIFQIDGDTEQTETFLVTKQRTTRVAINLRKIYIKPKDVVMICCRNNINNVIPALSALYLGAYVASVDPRQSAAEAEYVISMAKPKVIFVEEESIQMVKEALENSGLNSKIIVIGHSDLYEKMEDMEKESEEESTFRPLKQEGSDIAAILFSSGTTSLPKGILISNSYILNWGWRLVQHNTMKPDVLLHFSTLFWVSSWIILGACTFYGSCKATVSNAFSGKKFLQLVQNFRITYSFLSSGHTYAITNLPEEVLKQYDTSSLYSICISGTTMDPQQLKRLRKALPHTFSAMGYGSTEANCISYHDFTDTKSMEKISSSGTVTSDTEVKIVDLNTGESLGPNQEGEICAKSPFQMSGYHNFSNPDAFDKEGFLRTGDLGFYDEDKYIYVKDRLSEMFKYRTFQISPAVIEHVLLNHPAVAEAAVFGVFDPADGNHAAACVVMKDGVKEEENQLLEFVNDKVPDFCKLRGGLSIVDSIPKTPSGKIHRRSVRDLFVKSNKN